MARIASVWHQIFSHNYPKKLAVKSICEMGVQVQTPSSKSNAMSLIDQLLFLQKLSIQYISYFIA